MKTTQYDSLEIENFERFYEYLHKKFEGILGAEWDKETKTLKIFYEDKTTELPLETLQKLKLPTILRFKKKVSVPVIDVPDTVVTSSNENEFVVETFDVEAVRKTLDKSFQTSRRENEKWEPYWVVPVVT